MSAMHELETLETSAVDVAEMPEDLKSTESFPWAKEVMALQEVYPDFDPEAELAHPILGAILRGEVSPSLRQLYEAIHWEEIAAVRTEAAISEAVAAAVSAAVESAVASAVAESEERLLSHIRARGQRPAENGTGATSGARLQAAVGRLTRRERAMLAKRAENGEHIRL